VNATFPITRSVPDSIALGQEIKRLYPIYDEIWCGLTSRNMTDIFQVRSGRTRYAARVWRHDFQTEDEIRFQTELLLHLSDLGLPVTKPIRCKDGGLYFSIPAPEGKRFVSLFEWVEGNLMGIEAHHEHFRRSGELIALMQKAGQDFSAPSRRLFDLGGRIRKGLVALSSMISDRPNDLAFYEEAVNNVCNHLENIDPNTIPFGICHGDFHALNASVGADGSVTLFDFDCCSFDWLMHDVVCFDWANGRSTRGQTFSDSFIAGYESVRTISSDEHAQWPFLRAAHELFYVTVVPDILQYTGFAHMNFRSFEAADISVRKSLKSAGLA